MIVEVAEVQRYTFGDPVPPEFGRVESRKQNRRDGPVSPLPLYPPLRHNKR